jgi:hypothetical protein
MHVDYSRHISHPTTLGTIHIRHVNSVAPRGVLKAGVDCIQTLPLTLLIHLLGDRGCKQDSLNGYLLIRNVRKKANV